MIHKGVNMKKQIIRCLITVLFLLVVSGCSTVSSEKVTIYEMISFSETNMESKKIITNLKDINILETSFNGASKNPGLTDMIDPNYKVELAEETYFLWINEISGTIMNVNDTHITYTLTEKSVKEVNEVIISHFRIIKE